MTKNNPLSRPAMSAIAAFLAISASGALAQETPTITMIPPVAAPPTVTEPGTAAPTPAPQSAQPPTAKPVIQVPLDLPAEPAEPAPKAAEPAPAPARAERGAAATRKAEPARNTQSARATAERPPVAADVDSGGGDVVPIAAPVMAPADPMAETAPLPAGQTATSGDAFPWEIAGGAAALLLVGGVGLAFARRRAQRAIDDDASYEDAASYEAEPATGEPQPWVTPPYNAPREEAAAPTPQPALRSTPAFAAAPSGSMGRHEAMALAGPTDDNPFATLKKRLQRARFLDRQERVEYDALLAGQQDMQRKPASAWEIAQRDVAPPAEQEVRRPDPSRRPAKLRPGFSGN